MKETRELEGLIIKLQSGEISLEEEQRLHQLAAKYPDYQDLLATHRLLARTPQLIGEPGADEFKQMRDTVLQSIRPKPIRAQSSSLADWFDSIRFFVQRPEIAVAALTLLVGFFLGRALPPQTQSNRGFIKQISLVASENKELKDVQDSPYRFSNISFDEIDSQKISLRFDVSTHMELVRSKNDPLVREVISQALLNPSYGGSELKAIAASENILDRKVKEALIFSLHNAPMLAVRMKALNTLIKYKNDPEVETAFLKVLKEEESVQLRLMVLDYFEEIKFNRDVLKNALAGLDMQRDSAVLLRAKKYIEKND